jgi:hypothetical protein
MTRSSWWTDSPRGGVQSEETGWVHCAKSSSYRKWRFSTNELAGSRPLNASSKTIRASRGELGSNR